MEFKAHQFGISAGHSSVVLMTDDDAFKMGAQPGDRVVLSHICDGQCLEINAIIDHATVDALLEEGTVGLFDEVWAKLKLDAESINIKLELSSKPESFQAIKKKIKAEELSASEMDEIISDCVNRRLLPIEIASFITALEINGLTDREVVYLTKAMANSGEVLDFGDDVYDKHSTGGVPGNKVTLLIVPIITAAGMFIPKTSTRAITSPSGTADSFEVLANVTFSKEEVINILKTERAGILWGGELDLAPADNALIQIEKPLNMDPFPLMIASIISKKLAMGVKKLVLDIPCGKGTKFPTPSHGRKYANRFKKIAEEVGIETICLLTSATQPIGHAVGPALEAREALRILIDPSVGPSSLRNKSCELAGILFEMAGKSKIGEGKDLAQKILLSGDAYDAFKRIIKNQGGDPDVKPEDIEVGPFEKEIFADKDGFVTEVENKYINRIAKIAGCPSGKKSGIEIERKIGQKVKKGDLLFKIYADTENKLSKALEYYTNHIPQVLGGMTIERI